MPIDPLITPFATWLLSSGSDQRKQIANSSNVFETLACTYLLVCVFTGDVTASVYCNSVILLKSMPC